MFESERVAIENELDKAAPRPHGFYLKDICLEQDYSGWNAYHVINTAGRGDYITHDITPAETIYKARKMVARAEDNKRVAELEDALRTLTRDVVKICHNIPEVSLERAKKLLGDK